MRLHCLVAISAFRRYSTYRWATVTGVFVNSVFGVIRCYILLALWDTNPHIGGYDATDAVTYCWLTQSLIMTTGIFGGSGVDEVATRVRTGDIVVDLYRPVNLQSWYMAAEFGRSAFSLLGRGVPPTIIGALLFGLRFPQAPLTWLAFTAAMVLGVVVGFSIRFLVALSGFWLVDGRGMLFLINTAGTFFSGFMLPINLFPGWLADLCYALPWVSMIQTPIDIFLGQESAFDFARGFGTAVAWAAVLLTAGHLLLARATRKVVVQGG